MLLNCPQPPNAPPKKTSVLLVEDNPGDAKLMQFTLRTAGNDEFEVVHAENMLDASVRLQLDSYDIVLLDLTLPDSSGLETLEQILPKTTRTPVIVLTGLDDESTGISAVQAGAADYLIKGKMEDRNLLRAIRFSIERHQILRNIQQFDEAKSQFLATASHEMRTPLAVIREYSSLIHDGLFGATTEEQKDSLEVVLRNCDRLNGLLNNILDLRRVQSDQSSMHLEKCSVAELIERCEKDFLLRCSSNGQSLSTELAEALQDALADPFQIEQVLTNFVGNACKFTPEGGSIVLRALEVGDFLRVEVQDTGRGVPPDKASAIFEAFGQVEKSDVSIHKGAGLGLTISREIVLSHGGEIGLLDAVGGGSIFWFTLPIWSEAKAFLSQVESFFSVPTKTSACVLVLRPVNLDIASFKRAIQPSLRSNDELFEFSADGVVTLLLQGDRSNCATVVDRIANEKGCEFEWASFVIQRNDLDSGSSNMIDLSDLEFIAGN
jgi:signal transduction histidine kinase